MLQELSKNDAQWRKMAFYICKDKDLADDITNDMYIKVHESKKKFNEINEWYIYVIMKNIYLHYLRILEKTIKLKDTLKNIPNQDDEILKDRILIHRAVYELEWLERHILLHTAELSLRQAEKYLGINYSVLHYHKKKGIKNLKETSIVKDNFKLKQTLIIKTYKNA